ncbi:MAG: ECF transporter S component [Clostridiales Family XIII bacterium]|jgi:riboflavin transporter FmnP|nr:ECF transporter S component [Clostridiales Family XIII bacterium]
MKTPNENRTDEMRAALAAEAPSAAELRLGGAKERTKRLTTIAMLSAVACIVAYLSSMLIPDVMGFLQMDFSDTVSVIGGFLFGPLAAMFIVAAVSSIEALVFSHTGLIGLIMNVLSGISFACVAAFIYKRKQTMSGAIVALVSGILAMTAVMLLWNYIITPLYMTIPREQVAAMLIPVFLPFNLVKGSANASLSVLLYKRLVTALRRAQLIPPTRSAGTEAPRRASNKALMIPAAVVLLTCALVLLAWAGII